MDYPAWKSGKRLVVDGNKTSWVSKSGSDDSYETFLKYLRTVMIYAGTLSLNEEAVPVNVSDIQAGDMFIKGGVRDTASWWLMWRRTETAAAVFCWLRAICRLRNFRS